MQYARVHMYVTHAILPRYIRTCQYIPMATSQEIYSFTIVYIGMRKEMQEEIPLDYIDNTFGKIETHS